MASSYRPAAEAHAVAFAPRGSAVPLQSDSGPRGIELFVNHRYAIVEAMASTRVRWTANTVGYRYDVLDRDGREILTYHWHPEAAGPDFPHLHISGRINALAVGKGLPPVALGEMHLPTDLITFAAVVRLLITEFGIEPHRDDWLDVLAASAASSRPRFALPP